MRFPEAVRSKLLGSNALDWLGLDEDFFVKAREAHFRGGKPG